MSFKHATATVLLIVVGVETMMKILTGRKASYKTKYEHSVMVAECIGYEIKKKIHFKAFGF